jgi:hypothetical protein
MKQTDTEALKIMVCSTTVDTVLQLLNVVFRIRIGFNADPHTDPDSAF